MSDVYTGKDTIIIDGRLIEDLATGKVVEARFPNNISNSEVGKNGSSINTYIANGVLCEITLRVLIGSKTDQYLTLRKSQWENDPASFVALTGSQTAVISIPSGQTFCKLISTSSHLYSSSTSLISIISPNPSKPKERGRAKFI